MSKIIRVVPVPVGEYGEGAASKCSGTKVYLGDERIKGITKITLVAIPGNVWRATIEAIVQVEGEIVAAVIGEDARLCAPVVQDALREAEQDDERSQAKPPGEGKSSEPSLPRHAYPPMRNNFPG